MLPARERRLTAAQFRQLADAAPEAEWFACPATRARTAGYNVDLRHFMDFTAIAGPKNVFAWSYAPWRHLQRVSRFCELDASTMRLNTVMPRNMSIIYG